MLQVRDLRKRYRDVVALDGVDFCVARGQLVGFLGPNGAGKTTAMRAVLQLVSLDSGSITWDGSPITAPVRRSIGYMPAERGMYPKMRVHEHLVYCARLAGLDRRAARQAADRGLEAVELTDRADALVQTLSSGNQQRLQVALALVHEPQILILDEPFSGLDPVAVNTLKALLLERVRNGAALLFSSHQLDVVEDVSRDVVIIDRGRVMLQGDVDAIRSSAAHRYVQVGFDTHVDWRPTVAGSELIETHNGRVRLRVERDVDKTALLADAERHGRVNSFTFAPPELSEVFLAAVGRRSVDDCEERVVLAP